MTVKIAQVGDIVVLFRNTVLCFYSRFLRSVNRDMHIFQLFRQLDITAVQTVYGIDSHNAEIDDAQSQNRQNNFQICVCLHLLSPEFNKLAAVRSKFDLKHFAVMGDLGAAPEVCGFHIFGYAAFFKVEGKDFAFTVIPVDGKQTDT